MTNINLKPSVLVALLVAKTTKFGSAKDLLGMVDSGHLTQEDLVGMLTEEGSKVGELGYLATQAESPKVESPKPDKENTHMNNPNPNPTSTLGDAVRASVRQDLVLNDSLVVKNKIFTNPLKKEDFLPKGASFFAGININGKSGFLAENSDPGKYQMSAEMGQLMAVDIKMSTVVTKDGFHKPKGIWTAKDEKNEMVGFSFRLISDVTDIEEHRFDETFVEEAEVPRELGRIIKAVLDGRTVNTGAKILAPKPTWGGTLLTAKRDSVKLISDTQKVCKEFQTYINWKHDQAVNLHLVGYVTIANFHKSLRKGKLDQFEGYDNLVGAITSLCLFVVESQPQRELQMGPYRVGLKTALDPNIPRNNGSQGKVAKMAAEEIQSGNIAGLVDLASHFGNVAEVNAQLEAELGLPE